MSITRDFQEDFSNEPGYLQEDDGLRYHHEISDAVARTVHALGVEVERLIEFARANDRPYVENELGELEQVYERFGKLVNALKGTVNAL